jgi:hypothetical protein
MRIDRSLSGPVVPGLIAGGIYFVSAIAAGASAAASIIGEIVVAIIAIVIRFDFKSVFARRTCRVGADHSWRPAA